MTFSERFLNFGMNVLFDGLYSFYYLPVMEELYREKVGSETPGSGEILGKASMILSNGHFALARPKPNLPDVVDVGGIHSRKAKPLPKVNQQFFPFSIHFFKEAKFKILKIRCKLKIRWRQFTYAGFGNYCKITAKNHCQR